MATGKITDRVGLTRLPALSPVEPNAVATSGVSMVVDGGVTAGRGNTERITTR